jgi:ribA/ribD-fused uncharacterized protein
MPSSRDRFEVEPAIRFYSVNAEYGELSNFALYPITLKGKRWPTSEHYFQAQKFVDARDQEEIRNASTPPAGGATASGSSGETGSGSRSASCARRSKRNFASTQSCRCCYWRPATPG